jgi:glycine/D-amino acid oxidase-like deaminating enzyme
MDEIDETRAIAHLVQRLAERFPEIGHDVIEQVVVAEHEGYADAPVRDFVPVLVEHSAVERLWLLAHAERQR